MKKLEMCAKISEQAIERWNMLQVYSREFGKKHPITEHARAKWAAIDELADELEIVVDYDNKFTVIVTYPEYYDSTFTNIYSAQIYIKGLPKHHEYLILDKYGRVV